jgi:sugar phosphate isomerase/epimerase
MQISRRQFISQASGALALGGLANYLRASSPSPAWSPLGMSLYGMKSLPLGDAVAQCARIGYQNVELCIDPGFPADPAKLRDAARRQLRVQARTLGLKFSGLMLNLDLANAALHDANLEAIAGAAALANALAPDEPPPIETVMRGKPAQWEALKTGLVQRLGDWADAGKAGGIRFVIKAHISMVVNSPERLLWLLHEVNRPEIRVAFDYSHYEVAGLNLDRCWEQLRPWVDFVHVKDTAGTAKKPVFLLPGEGHTDYAHYFRMLKKSDYRGPVVVEVSTQIFSRPNYDPIKAAENSYAALFRALSAADSNPA